MGVGVFCTGKRGWVGRESAFFILVGDGDTHHPTPGAPCIPRRWRPQPPAHPERLHSTGSGTDHAKHGTYARTLDTLHRGRSGRRRGWRVCSVSETEQIRTLERYAKTGLKIITILCMFVARATLQIHEKVLL